MIGNAAVFIGKGRRYKGVNVEYKPDEQAVVLTNRITNDEIIRYSVVEVAKTEMAWDIMDGDTLRRLVAQQGCGCGGMHSYKVDEGYSGAL